MKILMSFNDWNANATRRKLNTHGGIGYYRIIKPAEQIRGHEVTVIGKELSNFGKTNGEVWENIFKEYDVFWTHYFKEDKNAAAMFYMAKKYGKKVIIDLDDNFWDIPESNLLYDQYKAGKKDRSFLSTILFFADVITTSTEPLRERIIKHFKDVDGTEKKVVVIPNMNDSKDWVYPKVKLDPEKFTIGYHGSNSHHDDLKMILPSIINIMKKHKHVQLEVLGAIGRDQLNKYFDDMPQSLRNRVGLIGATETFQEFPEWLSQQKWDVGICPLVDTAFTRSKSHIKFMEYASVGIPCIASRVYPYFMKLWNKSVIIDGHTGLLCKENEWEKNLERIINSKELRSILSKNAQEYVKSDWQYDGSQMTYVIDEMLKRL